MRNVVSLGVRAVSGPMHRLLWSDRGQTTVEYVAITAVGVALAIGVVFGLLNAQLTSALGAIGDELGIIAGAGDGGEAGGDANYVSGNCTSGSWNAHGAFTGWAGEWQFDDKEPPTCDPGAAPPGPFISGSCQGGWWGRDFFGNWRFNNRYPFNCDPGSHS